MNGPRRVVVPLLAAGLALGLSACGDDDESAGADPADAPPPAATASALGTTATTPAPPPRPTALPGLPAFTAGFEGWDRLNAKPIPPDSALARRVGVDAHRGTKNVYVNVPKEQLTPGEDYPDGTIVVKAARNGGAITLVATMRKIQGIDPAHGDWKFVEYKRPSPGSAFATDASLTGATCWGCHAIAASTDSVFTPVDP